MIKYKHCNIDNSGDVSCGKFCDDEGAIVIYRDIP